MPSITEKDVETAVGLWLTHAGDRIKQREKSLALRK
jgi:hypothetical protein